MDIKDLLSPDDALIKSWAADKTSLLKELATRAAAALDLDPELVIAEVLKREALGSTGTGDGVAIPHARIPTLTRPFGILVRLQHAIEFEAIDGLPVDIVFQVLLPQSKSDPLNALASVARRLRNPETRKLLRSAADDAALYVAIEQTQDLKATAR